jgi:IclR family pca regulon transcriptional regulator
MSRGGLDGSSGMGSVDGSRVDGSRVDGSRVDGSRVGGSRVEGSRVGGSRVGGSRVEGGRVLGLSEPRYSQSVERGLAILGCFTPQRSVLGIADIAEMLGMSRSTTHRYAITLVALGYLEQAASRKYRLGLRVSDLGMSALNSTGLREPARAHLASLRRKTSYTASLAVLDGTEIVYVERARSFRRGQHEIEPNLRPGSRLPAYCTSMGKVLLANLPETELQELIAATTLTRHGPNTIATKKALRAELALVLDEGIAVENEELAAGLISLACPIRTKNGQVRAAIDLATHTSTTTPENIIDQYLPNLLTTADHISTHLGYQFEDTRRSHIS